MYFAYSKMQQNIAILLFFLLLILFVILVVLLSSSPTHLSITRGIGCSQWVDMSCDYINQRRIQGSTCTNSSSSLPSQDLSSYENICIPDYKCFVSSPVTNFLPSRQGGLQTVFSDGLTYFLLATEEKTVLSSSQGNIFTVDPTGTALYDPSQNLYLSSIGNNIVLGEFALQLFYEDGLLSTLDKTLMLSIDREMNIILLPYTRVCASYIVWDFV
jgi:hypothetical protein